MTAFQAEGCGSGFAADYKKSRPAPSRHFDRSEAEWRNLTPQMTEKLPPFPSFRPKRSGVEKSPPLMVRAALRWEISRLRVSWEHFPSAPYQHAAPLEMTVLASAPLVISTEAKRSGEISSSDGTGGITVGDLSTQSIINAFSICPIPTCSPARDDGGGGHHWTHLRCEGSEDAPRGRKGARLRRRLCRRVASLPLRGQRPFGPRVVVAPFGAQRTHFEGALATHKM